MGQYTKFVVMLVGAVLVAIAGVLPVSGHLTQAVVLNIVIVGIGALKVFLAPNVGGPGWFSGGAPPTAPGGAPPGPGGRSTLPRSPPAARGGPPRRVAP